MKHTNQKGFTLLELLVVVAIIGILAFISIPVYNNYNQKAQRAAIISECRSLYRSFVMYYIEYSEYPLAATENEYKFNLETFAPLTSSAVMVGFTLDIDIERFRNKLAGRKAEKFDSPDDMGDNQEYYLVMPWAEDPNVKFVVASSDNVLYDDGTVVDGGNWIDGVLITKDGAIIQ